MHFLILQHVSFEGPQLFSRWLAQHGHSFEVCEIWREGVELPPLSKIDGLIIMGGPMSVHDEANYKWLAPEKKFVRKAIENQKKVLGICLGAQMISDVLGGRVYSGKQKEIGWFPIQIRSLEGEHLFGRKGHLTVFHWHGETFILPPKAQVIASSEVTENQAFLIGNHVLGLQFHLEMTKEGVGEIVAHSSAELASASGPYVQAPMQMTSNEAYFKDCEMILDGLMSRFLGK